MHPFYVIRAIGGGLFVLGALIMAYNVWKTIASSDLAVEPESRPRMVPAE
jgi:cytochrome c oxidase cbb3-type subunit 1